MKKMTGKVTPISLEPRLKRYADRERGTSRQSAGFPVGKKEVESHEVKESRKDVPSPCQIGDRIGMDGVNHKEEGGNTCGESV